MDWVQNRNYNTDTVDQYRQTNTLMLAKLGVDGWIEIWRWMAKQYWIDTLIDG